MDTVFYEIDDLQRLLAEPIPEEIRIPNSSQHVEAHLKKIIHPIIEENEHRGKII